MRRRDNVFVRLFDAIRDFVKKRPFRSIVSAVLIVAVLAGVIVAFFQNSPGGTVFYYVENNELYRANGTNSGIPVSGRFITGSAAASSESAELLIPGLTEYVTESGSGRYIYYPDNNSAEDPAVTVYCRKTDGSDEPVRVDSGITRIIPSTKNHGILYEKADALYRFSPSGGTEVLVYGFRDYVATGNLDIVAYIDGSGSLFLKNGSKAPEELDRDATSVGVILTGGTVWYVKNEVLYKKAPGADNVKITSDAYEQGFIRKGSSAGFYFLTYERIVDVAYDLLHDDLLASDNAMAEPAEPVLPSRSAYPSSEEYEAALSRYNQDYEQYRKDLAEYSRKLFRDNIRTQLRGMTIVRARVTLNYCDGDKISPVCRDIYAAKGFADADFWQDNNQNSGPSAAVPGGSGGSGDAGSEASQEGTREGAQSGAQEGGGDVAADIPQDAPQNGGDVAADNPQDAPQEGSPPQGSTPAGYAAGNGLGGVFPPITGGRDAVAYFKAKESEPVMADLEAFDDYQSALKAAENTHGSTYELEFARGTRKLYTEARGCPAGGFSGDGKYFYYLSAAPEAGAGAGAASATAPSSGAALYAVHEVDLAKLTDTVIDSGASSVGFVPGDCIYFKEVNEERGRGILYFKGKKIAEDVTLGSPVASGKSLFYFTDYSGNKSGTLYRYGGRKSKKVADDVHAFAVTGNGSVVFTGDFRGSGLNKLYFGSVKNVVSENISGIFVK